MELDWIEFDDANDDDVDVDDYGVVNYLLYCTVQ